MNYYVFPPEDEAVAIAAQTSDYDDYIASLPTEKDDGEGGTIPIDNSAYISKTTSWDNPLRQRATDNSWVYLVCPTSTATGRTIEALDTGGIWFPVIEE